MTMVPESHERSAECQAIFEKLSEFLDAELPAESCEQIRRHIAGCGPCVQFVESLKRSIELCREYESRDAPAPLKREAREELLASYRKMLEARSKLS